MHSIQGTKAHRIVIQNAWKESKIYTLALVAHTHSKLYYLKNSEVPARVLRHLQILAISCTATVKILWNRLWEFKCLSKECSRLAKGHKWTSGSAFSPSFQLLTQFSVGRYLPGPGPPVWQSVLVLAVVLGEIMDGVHHLLIRKGLSGVMLQLSRISRMPSSSFT